MIFSQNAFEQINDNMAELSCPFIKKRKKKHQINELNYYTVQHG